MPPAAVNTQYDYIISGAGAAGLSLLSRMIASGKFTTKKILLVDRAPKTADDRTWCFWERDSGFFESIVYKSWSSLWFHATGFSKLFEIGPYKYKMIRGIDFYNFCFGLAVAQPNITIIYGDVSEVQSNGNETFLLLNGRKITAGYIFNSILFKKPELKKKEFYLLQHFRGWVIETSQPVFDQEQATLMDFRVPQDNGATFVYVMPFSDTKALVEFTVFSKQLLKEHEYIAGLGAYIDQQLKCTQYKVVSEEFGIIPMTNYTFPADDHNVINMGTAGGQTKASTGYTFMSIQKRTASIVANLLNNKFPSSSKRSAGKYNFYDSVLLNVLATGKLTGDKIFTEMFSRNKSSNIFQFLDNESTLSQDFALISSLPLLPFLKAGIEELF